MSTNWQEILQQLEQGTLRVATKTANGWKVNQEVKEAILAAFKAGENVKLESGYIDKHNLPPREFTLEDNIRLVPGGSTVRHGAYIAPNVVIMPPSYINIGAYVDSGTMIDSHVLVGSCAQIGKNVHLSAAVQIGGVLEPIGAKPTIIEDDVFVGAGAIIVEGIIVQQRTVIAPGVVLSKSIPIYDCVNETIIRDGIIPPGVVVIPGTRPPSNSWAQEQNLNIACPIIIKTRDGKSDASLELEQLLR